MTPQSNHELRICDEDRQKALECLQELQLAGYLTLDEYDERTSAAWQATTRGEISRLFTDIPRQAFSTKAVAKRDSSSPVQAATGTATFPTVIRSNASGGAKRLGICLIGTIGLITIGGLNFPGASLAILLIPILWIMFYILKIGPASWYQKPPGLLERGQQQLNQLIQPRDAFDPFNTGGHRM
ncbi:DUF1707 domain-containing protein [Corynebacterium choanae]|uniref:DUF1707 domain-containing protein n=1 Tax=Corynebacterium choanae TaxID=1862358 RepID=A0A3G6J4C8_9CORY|nr:DUF1707 domain-containing protein [Corynebacterium choanae]AZA12877.1 hypothetical protein CCHOA_02300 [Corynebacterium choanae]